MTSFLARLFAKSAPAVVDARPADAASFAVLHAAAFHRGWSETEFERLLADRAVIAQLARAEGGRGRVQGFILSRVAADEAEILTLGVRKDRQRHGIARRLVEAMARAAKKAEARRLFLDVGQSNTAALALYKGLGFQEIGRRKGYYEHAGAPAEDALVLALAL